MLQAISMAAPGPATYGPWIAPQMQSTLVPPIRHRGARVEVYGQSVPAEEVGGDLADIVDDGRDAMAYVADVSGHGLRAGVLMGMLKTAVRYGLLLQQPLAKLLDDLNRVLPAVKEPNMFATLAALRFDGSNQAEYVSAGHVPLLQYRSRDGRVVWHSMSQFPLGLFAGPGYRTRRIPYEPGDVFALITDGIVETGEDPDPDAGFSRLGQIVSGHAGCPLSEIVEAIRRDVRRDAQRDDETVLLIRVLQAPDGGEGERWQRLFEGLLVELAQD